MPTGLPMGLPTGPREGDRPVSTVQQNVRSGKDAIVASRGRFAGLFAAALALGIPTAGVIAAAPKLAHADDADDGVPPAKIVKKTDADMKKGKGAKKPGVSPPLASTSADVPSVPDATLPPGLPTPEVPTGALPTIPQLPTTPSAMPGGIPSIPSATLPPVPKTVECKTGIPVLDAACTRLQEAEKARLKREQEEAEKARLKREQEVARGINQVVEDANKSPAEKDRDDRVIITADIGRGVGEKDESVVFGGDVSFVIGDLEKKGIKTFGGFFYRRSLGTVKGKTYDGRGVELEQKTDRFGATVGMYGPIVKDVTAQLGLFFGADFAIVDSKDDKTQPDGNTSVLPKGNTSWPVAGLSTTWIYYPGGHRLGMGGRLEASVKTRQQLPGEDGHRTTVGGAASLLIAAAF